MIWCDLVKISETPEGHYPWAAKLNSETAEVRAALPVSAGDSLWREALEACPELAKGAPPPFVSRASTNGGAAVLAHATQVSSHVIQHSRNLRNCPGFCTLKMV